MKDSTKRQHTDTFSIKWGVKRIKAISFLKKKAHKKTNRKGCKNQPVSLVACIVDLLKVFDEITISGSDHGFLESNLSSTLGSWVVQRWKITIVWHWQRMDLLPTCDLTSPLSNTNSARKRESPFSSLRGWDKPKGSVLCAKQNLCVLFILCTDDLKARFGQQRFSCRRV